MKLKEKLISIYLKLLKYAAIALGIIGVLFILIAVTVQGDAGFFIIPGIPWALCALYWGVIYISIQQVEKQQTRIQLVLYYFLLVLSFIPVIGYLVAPFYFSAYLFDFVVENLLFWI